ncbi:MAG: allantoicase [Acidobacteriota bacterium]
MEFTTLIDLAAERLGGAVISTNDEFFAPAANLLKPGAATFVEGKYTDRGKWMDGWETRRRRQPGHDWCIVRLGQPGLIRGIVVDTAHFKGNFPESCSLDACEADDAKSADELKGWKEILVKTVLAGDLQNHLAVDPTDRATHVRLNIFPDGGVARLRVYGQVVPDWRRLGQGEIDLASIQYGSLVVASSDMFFGSRHNLILPGPALDMSDGWETRRRRGPGHDWAIVQLGIPGTVRRIEVDTTYFKGNAPGSCSIEGRYMPIATTADLAQPLQPWKTLLERTSLQPHAERVFEVTTGSHEPITHARLNIFPDGGIARLRLVGTPETQTRARTTQPRA